MPPLLRKEEKLGEGVNLQRWSVVKKIGDGGFAEVYEVADAFKDDEKFAVKIDKMDKRKDPRSGTVKAEVKVLRQLQMCPQVCRLVPEGEGTYGGRSYMIMELLGVNLAQFRHSSPHGRILPELVKKIALCLLRALDGVHRAGYIHRDVKPANFVLASGGTAAADNWRIIDFGIARRFVDDAGRPLPKREDFGEFRGSTTYASIHAHLKQDLGRRDDLWSWLYIVVEMLEGNLPWRAASGDASAGSEHSPKETAMRVKQDALNDPNHLCCSGKAPEALVAISKYLRSLSFADEPDYDLLRECIASLPSMPALQPRAVSNGPSAPSQPQQQQQQQQQQQHSQYPQGQMWPHAVPTTAPQPLYANGAPPAAPHMLPRMLGGFSQLPHAAYAQMQAQNPYWPYAAQHLHTGIPHYMHGYAAAAPRPPLSAPITLTPPVQQQHNQPHHQQQQPQQQQRPSPLANGGPPRQHAAMDGDNSAMPSTARLAPETPVAEAAEPAMDFDIEDQLGQIGSAFDEEEDLFQQAARPQSNGRAGKRPAPADEEAAADELRAAKCVRFSPAVAVHMLEREPVERQDMVQANVNMILRKKLARAEEARKEALANRRPGWVSAGAIEDLKGMAAVVARGQLSEGAKEVRDKLRRLDPAEGIGILAWLVDSLSRNVDRKATPQVVQWLGGLAAFSDECALRCQATRQPQQA